MSPMLRPDAVLFISYRFYNPPVGTMDKEVSVHSVGETTVQKVWNGNSLRSAVDRIFLVFIGYYTHRYFSLTHNTSFPHNILVLQIFTLLSSLAFSLSLFSCLAQSYLLHSLVLLSILTYLLSYIIVAGFNSTFLPLFLSFFSMSNLNV